LAPGTYVKFTSNKYPEKYPGRVRCGRTFKVSSDGAILSIVCNPFSLKNSNNCKKDYLQLYDNVEKIRYCGTGILSTTSSTGVLKAFFKTNRYGTSRGFVCEVSAILDSGSSTTSSSTTSSSTVTPDPNNNECSCGKVTKATRIVGGQETGVHEYPWQVALTGKSSNRPYCGGSIIADSWIVTAAHCVSRNTASNSDVVIGEHDWTSSTETTVKDRRSIFQTIQHPQYSSRTLNNDIALVQLASPITFNSDNKVAPVCLPPPTQLFSDVNAIITGWGTLTSGGSQPAKLQEVTIPTMTNTKCTRKYGSGMITNNMICAGVDAGGKDSCQGDSGGPMVAKTSDSSPSMSLIGIVSWGYGCADADYPGVYTRVNQYLDWISGYTSGSKTCNPV